MLHDENEAHELESVDAALVKAVDWPPDLVLVGQNLLQSEGLAVLRRLITALPGTQVLLVGNAEDPVLNQALAEGAHGLIAVPLKLETVRKAVDQALGRR
jgi:CheY-like chemotaxis protein